MNLNSKSNGDSNTSAAATSSAANSGFKSLAEKAGNSKRSALEPAANNSPAKKLKTTSSSFLNSYSWFLKFDEEVILCRLIHNVTCAVMKILNFLPII